MVTKTWQGGGYMQLGASFHKVTSRLSRGLVSDFLFLLYDLYVSNANT